MPDLHIAPFWILILSSYTSYSLSNHYFFWQKADEKDKQTYLKIQHLLFYIKYFIVSSHLKIWIHENFLSKLWQKSFSSRSRRKVEMLQKNYFALFGKENANNIHGTFASSAEGFWNHLHSKVMKKYLSTSLWLWLLIWQRCIIIQIHYTSFLFINNI